MPCLSVSIQVYSRFGRTRHALYIDDISRRIAHLTELTAKTEKARLNAQLSAILKDTTMKCSAIHNEIGRIAEGTALALDEKYSSQITTRIFHPFGHELIAAFGHVDCTHALAGILAQRGFFNSVERRDWTDRATALLEAIRDRVN